MYHMIPFLKPNLGNISRMNYDLCTPTFIFKWLFLINRMEIIHRTRRNADAMRIQKMCLVILRQLSILDPDCSLALSTCDPLLAHCFRLLKSTTLTETACDLIEHLLLSRNELVQLDGFSKIYQTLKKVRFFSSINSLSLSEKLSDVLQQLDDETLSQTYRVLSLAVSDVDECENRASRKIFLIHYVHQSWSLSL
jgi:hypothetical protein